MKKITISGYYGFDNFGDESVLKILTDKLHNEDVTVISINPTKTALKYKVNSIKTFNFVKIINEIRTTDILISGGGSLLQDITGFKSLLYYLWVINTALFFKKKVIIFAQGIGPLKRGLSRILVKNTLKKCDTVTVRDDKSLFLLRGWGISKTDLVCDPLFDLPVIHHTTENSGIIGVQLRDFKTLSDKLLNKLATQICHHFFDKAVRIYSLQNSIDLKICKKFEFILKSINPNIKCELIQTTDYQELAKNISELDYMIAMRFHACLTAIKCGTKTLAIAYDDKVEKLAYESEIPQISMLADENFDFMFNRLKSLSTEKLRKYADKKHFDWDKYELLNTCSNSL